MSESENPVYLLTITGPDQSGVVADITNYLFEIGGNLADTAFAVLGQGFEYSGVTIFTEPKSISEITDGLAAIKSITGARITLDPFPYDLMRNEVGDITHVIEFVGGDRPGLVAGMASELSVYNANIVRMNSRRVQLEGGGQGYRTRFAVNIPAERATVCGNALSNLAGSLDLKCTVEPQ